MVYIYDSCRNSRTLVPIFYPVMPRYEYCHILFLLVYRIATTTKIYHVHKTINFIKKIRLHSLLKMTLPRLYKKYCIDNRVYYLFDIF